eukprot:Sspe_Gene.96810::Locus_70099_Transcript_1_1_Confidence_1.000_Length_743::g.96810::m.96810
MILSEGLTASHSVSQTQHHSCHSFLSLFPLTLLHFVCRMHVMHADSSHLDTNKEEGKGRGVLLRFLQEAKSVMLLGKGGGNGENRVWRRETGGACTGYLRIRHPKRDRRCGLGKVTPKGHHCCAPLRHSPEVGITCGDVLLPQILCDPPQQLPQLFQIGFRRVLQQHPPPPPP